MTFTPDFDAALIAPYDLLVVPAHPNNFGYPGRANDPQALFWHTIEEEVDDVEFGPAYFARDLLATEGRQASSNYYGDSDGDLYQMVPDIEGAYATGVATANLHWKGERGKWAPWNPSGINYNLVSLSYELEGWARTTHTTFKVGGAQWRTAAIWGAVKCAQYDIPIDRDHLLGHEEVDLRKRDPGITYGFPMDDLVEAVRTETIASSLPEKLGWRRAIQLMLSGLYHQNDTHFSPMPYPASRPGREYHRLDIPRRQR